MDQPALCSGWEGTEEPVWPVTSAFMLQAGKGEGVLLARVRSKVKKNTQGSSSSAPGD